MISGTDALLAGITESASKSIGLGTVISMTLPYSISFLIALTLLLIIWMFIGLPIGPGASLWLN